MSYDLKDPQETSNFNVKSFSKAENDYGIKYSERVRLALTVASAFTQEERQQFSSAVEDLYLRLNDPTVMVHTGPLYIQCPYCGRG
jgi:hypothetical protein